MDIYIARGQEQLGPYPLDQVQQLLDSGVLKPDDFAFHEGLDNWTPLTEVIAAQASDLPPLPAMPAPAAPEPAAPVEPAAGTPPADPIAQPSASTAPDKPKKGVPIWLRILAWILVLGLILAVTIGVGVWYWYKPDPLEMEPLLEEIDPGMRQGPGPTSGNQNTDPSGKTANSLAETIVGKRLVCQVFGTREALIQFEKDGTFNVANVLADKIQPRNDGSTYTYTVEGLKAKILKDGSDGGAVSFPSATLKKGDKISMGEGQMQLNGTLLRIEPAAPFIASTNTTQPNESEGENTAGADDLPAKINALLAKYKEMKAKDPDKAGAQAIKDSRALARENPDEERPWSLYLSAAKFAEDPKEKKAILEEVAAAQSPKLASLVAKAKAELNMLDALGKPVDIQFTATDGTKVDLTKMKGKVVLIDFWATWCGPCIREIPSIKKTYAKLNPKGFEIVGISLDSDKDKLLTFIKENEMPWVQYFDGLGWKNKISTKYGIRSIPAMWLIDKNGNLIDKNARNGLEGKVEKLLAANAPTNNDNNNPSTNPVSENPDNDSLAELEQAAENGFTLAQTQLGLMHLTSQDPQKKDPALGIKWLERAAKQGHPAAQANAAQYYFSQNNPQKDLSKAAYWASLAARANGRQQTQYKELLAKILGAATPDQVKKSRALASNFTPIKELTNAKLKDLANQGNPRAQQTLGYRYVGGRDGINKDTNEAVRWWTRAARQGWPISQNNLGNVFSRGKIRPKDLVQAYMWASLANQNGVSNARQTLEQIGREITPAQIKEAQVLVQAFKPVAEKSEGTQPKPTKPDPKLIAKGQKLFQTKICFTCHQTDPKVPAPAGLALKSPNFMGDFWGKEREVHEGLGGPIKTVIFDEAYFTQQIRRPMDWVLKGALAPMPPTVPINDEELKALIAYVKSLSKSEPSLANKKLTPAQVENILAQEIGSWKVKGTTVTLDPKTGTGEAKEFEDQMETRWKEKGKSTISSFGSGMGQNLTGTTVYDSEMEWFIWRVQGEGRPETVSKNIYDPTTKTYHQLLMLPNDHVERGTFKRINKDEAILKSEIFNADNEVVATHEINFTRIDSDVTEPTEPHDKNLTAEEVEKILAAQIGQWQVKGQLKPANEEPIAYEFTLNVQWKEKGKSISSTGTLEKAGEKISLFSSKEYDPSKGVFAFRFRQGLRPEILSHEKYDPATQTFQGRQISPEEPEVTYTFQADGPDKFIFKMKTTRNGQLLSTDESIQTRIATNNSSTDPKPNTPAKKLTVEQASEIMAWEIGTWETKGQAKQLEGGLVETKASMECQWEEEGKSLEFQFTMTHGEQTMKFSGHKHYDVAKGVFVYRQWGEKMPESTSHEVYDLATKTYHGQSISPSNGPKTTTVTKRIGNDKTQQRLEVRTGDQLVYSHDIVSTRVEAEAANPEPTSGGDDKSAKIIEAAIRKAAKKPEGELTKADYEKVTYLNLNGRQLTSVKGLENLTQLKTLYLSRNQLTDVKGLEKLTRLKELYLNTNQLTSAKGLEKLTQLEGLVLGDNPDLTKAQIDQLQKALPKCIIISNPTK